MNKQTKTTDYGDESSILAIGARLEPIDLKVMTSGCHSLTVVDGASAFASGFVKTEDAHFNYSVELQCGKETQFNGELLKVEQIIFPHVIGKISGDTRRINLVELVASKVRELF